MKGKNGAGDNTKSIAIETYQEKISSAVSGLKNLALFRDIANDQTVQSTTEFLNYLNVSQSDNRSGSYKSGPYWNKSAVGNMAEAYSRALAALARAANSD